MKKKQVYTKHIQMLQNIKFHNVHKKKGNRLDLIFRTSILKSNYVKTIEKFVASRPKDIVALIGLA